MGTRSAVIIIEDEKAKGFYNQFDGYPDGGVGEEVVIELQKIDEINGWDQFKKNCKKVELVDENKKPSKLIQEKYNKFFNSGVSTGKSEEWYALLRELQGAKYIPEIMSGKVEHMLDGTNFIKDSLFCEYAYVIDLDKMVLELYKGFQKEPQKGNRFGEKLAKGEDTYYPCKKVGEIALKGIFDKSSNKNAVENKAIDKMLEIYKQEVEK
ncbi:MAG TPA: hypothetical protein VIH28_06915 [Ignavibacteriaceae bacterium]